MGSCNQPQTSNSIFLAYNGTSKVCIALLRLAIFDPHLVNPQTIWEIIDHKLEDLHNHSCAFQYVIKTHLMVIHMSAPLTLTKSASHLTSK
ncbi:hypothetical protein VP01_677g1 [Puccinia sorghi]|uniref:Uncharacterized protein n=1 Tax=Puccinia sorghi TaxID=27349 RepID=A0A0L6UEJ2_9BASI|nr:hypothetical protein VP01_677g1 [Puccinia sorghi]